MSAPGGRPAGRGGRPAVPGGAGERFERLLLVMDRLRSPGGCEWDGAQTHESLLRYLIEETYEVVEAVEAPLDERRRRDDLVEELGDILLQVVFHARIGQEHDPDGAFDITDVLAAVTDNLVRRHPTVFGSSRRAGAEAGDAAEDAGTAASGSSDEELSARWDAVKRAEKPHRTGVFDGIPPALPALAYAEKALSKARRHGVEPRTAPHPAPSPAAIRSGASSAASQPTPPDGAPEPAAPGAAEGFVPAVGEHGARERAEAELGERLFEQVRAASAAGLDAERALRETVRRYIRSNNRPVSDTPGGDR